MSFFEYLRVPPGTGGVPPAEPPSSSSPDDLILLPYQRRWIADTAAFLSYDLIQSCECSPGEPWELPSPSGIGIRPPALGYRLSAIDHPQSTIGDPHLAIGYRLLAIAGHGRLFLGVDVGRDHDLTVIWVLECVGDVFFTRAVECLQNQTFEAQAAALRAWLERPEVKRCCMDATGIGRQFAEQTRQQFGPYRVEPIHFTAPIKEELAYPVRAAFESRRPRIPCDPLIRADLRAIKKETTLSGNVRFTADRGRNGHADRFWALALALHAGKTPNAAGPIHVFSGRSSQVLADRRQRQLAG